MEDNNAKELLELAESISLLGTWEIDLKTNQVFWSDGSFKMCGYQPNEFEITLESGLAIIHPEDRSLALEKINDAIEKGIPYEIRKRFITKDNSVIYILSKGKLIKDKEGNSIKLCGVFQDITSFVKLDEEYKAAINDLKSRNEFIETIVENLPIGIAVNKISNGKTTMVNSSFASIYGWTDQDLANVESFFEKVYPDEAYRKEIMGRVISDMQSGNPARMNWNNITVTTSNNEKRIINAKNIPLIEQDLMISTVTDVTEKSLLFEKIKSQQADLNALIENTEDLIYSVDMDFNLITFNTMFANFMRKLRNVDIKLGKNVFDYYTVDKKEFYLSIYQKVKNGESYTFENIIKFKNEVKYYEVLVNPIINSDNVQRGFSVFSKDITSKKIAEVEKEKAINELQKIMDSSLDVICTFDVNNHFVRVNAAAERVWGYKPDELIGKHYNILVHPDDIGYTNKTSTKIVEGTNFINFENRNVKNDGTLISMIWSANFNEKDQLTYCVAKDITEQKQNERALEQSHQLLKSAQRISKMGSWEYYAPTDEMNWDEEIYRIFEIDFDPNKKLTLKDFTQFIHPDDLEDFLSAKNELEKEDKPLDFQHRIITANQTIKYVKELGERVFNEETNSYWLTATIRDNTTAIIAIENIKKSEEKYKYLFESNPSCMLIFDFESLRIVDCNEEILLLYGYTREEFLNLSIRDIRPVEDIPFIDAATKDEETYGEVHKKVWRHQKKNGDIFYVDIVGHILNYEGRRCSLAQITDISKQLKTQEELKKSEEKYKILYQESPVPKIIYDAKTLAVLDINNVAIQVYGYSREEFMHKTLYDLRITEEYEDIKDILKRFKNLKNNKDFGVFKHRKKDGSILDVELFAHKFIYNNTDALMAVYTDITEKQKALEDLQDREEKLTLAQSLAKIGNWDYDVAEAKFNWSAELFKIFEIDQETFDQNLNESFIFLMDEKDQEKAQEIREKALRTGESFKFEYGITTKKGEHKVIEEIGYGERDKKGELIRFFGTSQDITERKKAEEQIKESELKYRSFFENSLDGILLTLTDGAILAANPAACEMFQMTEKEIIQKGRFGLVDKTDPRLYELLSKRKQEGSARGELTLIRKDGSKFEGELASSMFLDAQGNERTSMIVRDITQQKQYESEIKENNQRFEYVTQATSDAIWDWDLTKQSIYWGNSFYKLFGYTENPEQNNINFWENNIHPGDLKKLHESLNKAIDGNESKWNEVYRYKKADGTYAYVTDHGFIIRDEAGKAIRMVGAMSDITQKKLEEERLKLLESVATNTNDAVLITEAKPFDLPGPKILYVNEAFTKMTGYSAEEVMGKTPRILQGPLSDQNELKRLSKAIRNWESCEITTINYKKNGEPFWNNFSLSPVADETGWFTHWVAIERDVTAQKNVEENLQEALNEKNEILESIGDAFFAINREWTVTYWNKQAEKMLGFSKKKIIGHYLWNVFPDGIDSEIYIKYHQAMTEQSLVRFENYFEKLNSWYEISIYPSNTGLSVYLKDISERVAYTKAIEERNTKLREIAYTQSHIVRAPLARILGLTNLIDELQASTSEGKELLNYINISANELDNVIKDIVSKTENI